MHVSRSAQLRRNVHRSPAAVLAPSPKWWSSSDGRDIGKYGKVSGAAPVGPGIRPLRALEFRIERVVSDPFQVGSIRQTQEIRSASRVGHRPPSANVRAAPPQTANS